MQRFRDYRVAPLQDATPKEDTRSKDTGIQDSGCKIQDPTAVSSEQQAVSSSANDTRDLAALR